MNRNQTNHLEDLFRDHFEDFTVEPSRSLWPRIHAKLLWRQFLSFNLTQFNAYYLAAALLVAGGALFILSRSNDPSGYGQIPDLPGVTVSDTARSDRGYLSPETTTKEIPPEQETSVSPPVPSGPTDRESLDFQDVDHPPGVEESLKETPEKLESLVISSEDQKISPPEKPLARIAFSASSTSGCAPLAVKFSNHSENAVSYRWNFGDGGISNEKNPTYVFDESGEYTVVLRIRGNDGLEYMQQQVIQVFETPIARFEFDENVNLSEPVYFYNYSKAAQFNKWDFGDQQTSRLSDPVHVYQSPGTYHVKLKVWTENLCYDSLTIYNAFTSPENRIQFPTAFTPNLSGPSGGYYNGNDIGNTIFHPVIEGELLEYQLKIFNRTGVQVFESSDVLIGWDGYYQEEPAPQGVYIWKARGKFSNGKTFVQSGDVTLLRTR